MALLLAMLAKALAVSGGTREGTVGADETDEGFALVTGYSGVCTESDA